MVEYNNRPLTILMTTDTVGGVWTYCMELCRSLQPYGVIFHLVATGAVLQPWQRKEIEQLDNVQLYESTHKLEWMSDPWNDIEDSGEWLLQLERQVEPDIIHLNSYSYGSLPFDTPKIIVAHSDVLSWYHAVKQENPPAEWNEYYTRVKAGLRKSDMIIAPSNWMWQTIKQNYQPSAEYKIIYNGRTEDIFKPSTKQNTVISLGRVWDEAKNVQLLADAAPAINWPVKIAGEAKFEDERLEIHSRNVNYLGKLSTKEVAEELSTASIYVLPAKYEPFGLSAVEAALSGCALVLGDIQSLREIWGDAAIYVNTDNVKALAETVNNLITNKTLLQEYAFKSREWAKQYSAERFTSEYLQLYKLLVKQHQPTKSAIAI